MSTRFVVGCVVLALCVVVGCDENATGADDGNDQIAETQSDDTVNGDAEQSDDGNETAAGDDPGQPDQADGQDDDQAAGFIDSQKAEELLDQDRTVNELKQIAIDTDDTYDELGVVFSNPSGSGDHTSVRQTEDHFVEFCYEQTGCEGDDAAPDNPSGQGVGSAMEAVVATSDPDKTVVGARVVLQIAMGESGILEVGPGEALPDESSALRDEIFEFDEVLTRQEDLEEGTLLVIHIGDVD